ncbi:centromere-associated protein E [Lampris incognitus]|uniref:centromere-associated protein E n=1 Tax=Lampris incognitus TaxID=2546036 RepID=UPI0024B5AFF7|nr:centromere-associated protein E [Lampris incognitus]
MTSVAASGRNRDATISTPACVRAIKTNKLTGTIFAYGQTSSGKTFTMMGSDLNPGVIPMAMEDVFQTIKNFPKKEFLLRVSYMEIYNETVTDLLVDSWKRKPLEVRGTIDILESRERSDPASGESADGAIFVSHLNLVDLAGSERASQTGAEGTRFKEGCNINRSLFILGQVIKKLSEENQRGFTNYRDSKLTRILQNSLGGNAKTVIICTVTLAALDETLSTLQFASAAKNMKNDPHVTEVSDDGALLKRYRNEIVDLKRRLQEVSSVTQTTVTERESLSQLLQEKDQLQREQEDRIKNLTKLLVTSSNFAPAQKVPKRRVTWGGGKLLRLTQPSDSDAGRSDLSFAEPAVHKRKPNPSYLMEMAEDDEDLYSHWGIGDELPYEMNQCNVTFRSLGDSPKSFVSPNGTPELSEKMSDLELRLEAENQQKEEALAKVEMLARKVDELEFLLEARREQEAQHKPDTTEKAEQDATELDLRLQMEIKQRREAAEKSEMLESRVADLERRLEEQRCTHSETEEKMKSEFAETIQLCETLVFEKEMVSSERDYLRQELGLFMEQTENMEKEKAALVHELEEKREVDEFKSLEDKCREENENELQKEILSQKQALESSELKCQELEAKLEALSEELKKKSEWAEELQSMSGKDLVQEVTQLRQSLEDAEGLSRDTKKEWAHLRSQNIALKERDEALTASHEKIECELNRLQSELETEKSRYKKMQSDLQKELNVVFNENTKLTSLLDGKVPKNLIDSMELENTVANLNKELAESRDAAGALQAQLKELTPLRELPDKMSHLMKQVCELTEELYAVQTQRDGLLSAQGQSQDESQQLRDAQQSSQEEVLKLRGDLDTAALREQELIQRCSDATEQLDKLQSDLETVEETCLRLDESEQQRTSLEEKLNETQQLMRDLEEKLADSELSRSTEEEISKELQEQTAKLNMEISQLTEELRCVRAERDVLLSEKPSSAQSSTGQVEELLSTVTSLTQERDQVRMDLQEKVNTLTEELESVRAERDVLLSEKMSSAQSSTEVEELLPTIASLTEERDQLKMDLQENVEMMIEIQEELRTALEKNHQQKEKIKHLEIAQMTKPDGLDNEASLLQLEELKNNVETLSEEIQTVRVERDGLRSERDAVLSERDDLLHERDGLRSERDVVLSERDGLLHERDGLLSERDAVLSERDAVLSERDGLLSERDDLLSKRDGLLPERDAMLSERDGLISERDSLLSERDGLLSERVGLLSEREGLLSERDNLLSVRDCLLSERDGLLSKKTSSALCSMEDVEQLLSKVTYLTEERDQLQGLLEGLRQERNELRVEVEEKMDMVAQAQANVNQHHMPVSELKAQEEQTLVLQQQLEQLNAALQKVTEEKSRVEIDLQHKTETFAETQDLLHSLKEQLQKEQQTSCDLERVNQEKQTQFEQKADETWGLLLSLQEELQEHKQINSDLEKQRQEKDALSEQKIQQLEEQLGEVTEERDQVRTDLQEKAEMITENQGELRKAQEQIRVLRVEIDLVKSQKTEPESRPDSGREAERDLQLEQLQSQIQRVTEEITSLGAERDTLLSERDALLSERDALLSERDALLSERDALLSERDAVLAERDAVLSERDALLSERDTVLSKRDTLLSERDAVLSERDALLSERDTLLPERDALLSERDAVLSERDTVLSERDALLSERDSFLSEMKSSAQNSREDVEKLLSNVTCITEERDQLLKVVEVLKQDNQLKAEMEDKMKTHIVQDCDICHRYSKTKPKPAVGLPLASTFNETVAVDLHELEPGVWYLHIIDQFTRFSAGSIVKTKKSSEIVKSFLHTWIGIHSAPQRLYSDNGGEFNNAEFRDMAENFNIEMKTTAGYSPWSNGLLERHNQTLTDIILKAATTQDQQQRDSSRRLQDSSLQLEESFSRFQEFIKDCSKQSVMPKDQGQYSMMLKHLSAPPKHILEACGAVRKLTVETMKSLENIKRMLTHYAQDYKLRFEELVESDLAVFEETRLQDVLLFRAQASRYSVKEEDLQTVWEHKLSKLLDKRDFYLQKMADHFEKLQANVATYPRDLSDEVRAQERFNQQLRVVCSEQSVNWSLLDNVLSVELSRCSSVAQSHKMALQNVVDMHKGLSRELELLCEQAQTLLTQEKRKTATLLQGRENVVPATELDLLEDSRRLVLLLQQTEKEVEAMHIRIEQLEEDQVKSTNRLSNHKQTTQLLQTEVQDAYARVQVQESTIQTLKSKLQENEAIMKKNAPSSTAELENLRDKVVKLEVALTSASTKHQEETRRLTTLIDIKEDSLRRLKETLRKSQLKGEDSFLQGEDLHDRLTHPKGRTIQSSVILEKNKLEEEVKQLRLKITEQESLVASQQAESTKWKSRALKLKVKSKAVVEKPLSPCTPTKRCLSVTSESSNFSSSPKRFLGTPKKALGSPGISVPSSPKSQFFDVGTNPESLNKYYSKKFFDNSNLGTVPEVSGVVENTDVDDDDEKKGKSSPEQIKIVIEAQIMGSAGRPESSVEAEDSAEAPYSTGLWE